MLLCRIGNISGTESSLTWQDADLWQPPAERIKRAPDVGLQVIDLTYQCLEYCDESYPSIIATRVNVLRYYSPKQYNFLTYGSCHVRPKLSQKKKRTVEWVVLFALFHDFFPVTFSPTDRHRMHPLEVKINTIFVLYTTSTKWSLTIWYKSQLANHLKLYKQGHVDASENLTTMSEFD